ncbi:MAG: glycoside hydrolase family 25 protein [Clostridia bacterium]|nr:glycoside hydrolase family 25 protein [Clostridia bacterium]
MKKIFILFLIISIFLGGANMLGTDAARNVRFLKRGIDVSKWNGDINWREVANSGVEFAIIRTSFGWSNREKFTDRQLRNNINGAKSVGIPIGAYHYSYAKNPTEAIWEADFFIDRLRWTQWEYPVYIDFEDECQLPLTTQQRTDIVVTFLDRVKSAGYLPGIYCNLNWSRNYLDMDRLAGYELWIAQWNVRCACNRPYGIWQHTSSGNIPGIQGRVDLDYAYKDYPTYIKNNHLNGF